MSSTVEMLHKTSEGPATDFQPPVEPKTHSTRASTGGSKAKGYQGKSKNSAPRDFGRGSKAFKTESTVEEVEKDQLDNRAPAWTFNDVHAMNVSHWKGMEDAELGSNSIEGVQQELVAAMPSHLRGAAAAFFRDNAKRLEESRAEYEYEDSSAPAPPVKDLRRDITSLNLAGKAAGPPSRTDDHYKQQKPQKGFKKFEKKKPAKEQTYSTFRPSPGPEPFGDQ